MLPKHCAPAARFAGGTPAVPANHLCRTLIVRLAIAIMLAALSATLASAQKISPEEHKLVNYIDAHASEATALLEKTVNIESPTENLAGVREVGAIFKAEFESLGFTTR